VNGRRTERRRREVNPYFLVRGAEENRFDSKKKSGIYTSENNPLCGGEKVSEDLGGRVRRARIPVISKHGVRVKAGCCSHRKRVAFTSQETTTKVRGTNGWRRRGGTVGRRFVIGCEYLADDKSEGESRRIWSPGKR